jgi:hypothetical protein
LARRPSKSEKALKPSSTIGLHLSQPALRQVIVVDHRAPSALFVGRLELEEETQVPAVAKSDEPHALGIGMDQFFLVKKTGLH